MGGVLVSCGHGSKKWTVKFMVGETQFGEDVKVKDGEKVAKPETDPTDSTGMSVFGSWRTGSASGDAYDFDSPVTGDLTLYASFVGKCITFTAVDAGAKVKLMKYSNPAEHPMQYYDYGEGAEWKDYVAGTPITLTNVGDKVSFRAKGKTSSSCNSESGCYMFAGDGTAKFDVSGDVLSFYDPDCGELPATGFDYAFYGLFAMCAQLRDASSLVLPAMTVTKSCYNSMFRECTSLAAAPDLPATTLADECYNGMFYGCTSLESAPDLPATTLADECYKDMFNGCASLAAAPALPAMTLAKQCYDGMFEGCASLTSASALPAVTLMKKCYDGMFKGCTSLTSAPVISATVLAEDCFRSMFNGCTSLTSAPVLPVTTLAGSCYSYMFKGCTSLESAPALPATVLSENCYEGMFSGCTGLNSVPSDLLPVTALEPYCYENMFQDCTSLAAAPALPATTLQGWCYDGMFRGCTSLTAAPDLPATTLVSACYCDMFNGCTKLASVSVKLTDWMGTDETHTRSWLKGVASAGTFKCPSTFQMVTPSMTSGSDSTIPTGWKVENY